MPHKNKRKGSNWERKVIIDFKKFWPFAKSSRSSSQLLDNCKVDINHIPILAQNKATQMRPNYQVLYEECMSLIDKFYPKDEAKILKQKPYVVIHKDTTRRAGKGKPHVETMTFDYAFALELLECWEKHKNND